jgi:cell division protease FtsH
VDVFRVVAADGPPGTGKTLLAKSITGEARCAFFSSGSDLSKCLVSALPRVRDMFDLSRKETRLHHFH